jgi:hypothetical protein
VNGLVLPERIQLSRAKGWRKPDEAIVVARPGMWGNPFDASVLGQDEAVLRHALWLQGRGADSHVLGRQTYSRSRVLRRLPWLAGRPLACWCPPYSSCHAITLLQLANNSRGNQ